MVLYAPVGICMSIVSITPRVAVPDVTLCSSK